MIWLDHKYTDLVGGRLRNYKRKSGVLAVCSCPYCGDGTTKKNRARFYFITKDASVYAYCHNCNEARSLENLLKEQAPDLYDEYLKEGLLEKYSEKKAKQSDEQWRAPPPKFKPAPQKGPRSLQSLYTLPKSHPARLYCANRLIPQKHFSQIYFTPNFSRWANGLVPNKYPVNLPPDPRIVFELRRRDGTIFGYQGRVLPPSEALRFATLILDSSHPKVFGLDSVNSNEEYHVLEGSIDSLFLPNAIAMVGADIREHILPNPQNAVFVFDNEPRNGEIHRRMRDVIKAGFKICIWPEGIHMKDVNDMVAAGHDPVYTIRRNTFKGPEALLRLNSWKRKEG